MKMKWCRIVLICSIVATVFIWLQFGVEAAKIMARVAWLLFGISGTIEAYVGKNSFYFKVFLALTVLQAFNLFLHMR